MGAAIGARDTQGQSIRPPAIKSRAVRGLSIAGGLNLRPAGYEAVSADDLSHLIRQCGSKPGVLGLVEMDSVDVARRDQRSRVEERARALLGNRSEVTGQLTGLLHASFELVIGLVDLGDRRRADQKRLRRATVWAATAAQVAMARGSSKTRPIRTLE